MNLHGRNFVGDRLSSGTGETIRAASPLDRSTLEPAFFQAGASDVENAAELAEEAFAVFRETTGE